MNMILIMVVGKFLILIVEVKMIKYVSKPTDSKELASHRQIYKIQNLVATTDTDEARLLAFYGKSSMEYLTVSMAADCINRLLTKYQKKV